MNNFGFVPGKVFRYRARNLYKIGILLLVIAVALVALVAVMTWLGLTGKVLQGNISTTLTTPIPTMFPSTMSPTLRLPLRPSLIPQKGYTPTPLLQLAAEDGEKFGDSASMFTDWAIVGDHRSRKAYLYKGVLGAWYDGQKIQASDGSDDDRFGWSVSINEKIVVVGKKVGFPTEISLSPGPTKFSGKPNHSINFIFCLRVDTGRGGGGLMSTYTSFYSLIFRSV